MVSLRTLWFALVFASSIVVSSFIILHDRHDFKNKNTMSGDVSRVDIATSLKVLSIPHFDMTGIGCLEIASRSIIPSKRVDHDSKFRVLFFVSWRDINAYMDRHYFHLYCGALATSDLDTQTSVIWGPGWPAYDTNQSAAANVEKRFGAGYFHLVVGPRSLGIAGAYYVGYQHECYHEARSMSNCAEDMSRYNIQLFTYEQHARNIDLQKALLLGNPVSVQAFWPHSALPGPFTQNYAFPRVMHTRQYDLCLIGSVDAKLYPLRHQLSKWIARGVFQAHGIRAQQLNHPGYTDQLTDQQRVDRHINATVLERQYEQYVNFLFNCSMVVVTRSSRNYELRKYVEAAMASALLIGDVPTQTPSYTPFWGKFVIDIRNATLSRNITRVVSTIHTWLSPSHAELRHSRTLHARQLAFGQRTYQHAFALIQNLHHQLLIGKRGLVTTPWRNMSEF